ncbi:BTB/POZ domain-containing protein [Raphanus sativus]|uniref:BTB/POZ domain-containing protein At5g41330 n=1 Tax=Raphanus sativus TaxID=3726 RepID=A0A6J0NG92_RAPSA|nr:BTB/POZ domain-containing protein At5g41330 [Raphanus sativus]KAJ4902567.1 BTB/POZ domain-containing protein [Raphanus sativus]
MNTPATANESNIVSINVGGRIFQTTKQTLTLAGTDSPLSKLATESSTRFLDRDPALFSVLLYILRTGNLPARSTSDVRDLIEESRHYGIEPFLIDSLSNPSQFEAFDLRKSRVLRLNGRDSPSTIAPTGGGGLHVAHGSKITSFDWSLRRKSTVLTNFSAVDSLLEISPGVLAAGATDFPGLQIIDLESGGSVQTALNWENVASSTVQAVGSSSEFLFASFESSRRNSNSVMVYDLSTLLPVLELDRGSDSSAIPSTKLRWIGSCNLLMVSGSHASPSGVSGHVRFWDVRSRNMVCEINEREDCFADVTVSENLSAVFKVGVSSGEVFYTDLRGLGGGKEGDRWVCLGEERKRSLNERKGVGCKIESYGDHVFCSKGDGIELWSEVITGLVGNARRDVLEERVFRKNSFVAGSGENKVTGLVFGGSRMFVTRKDQQAVEVWQSSSRGVSM